MTKLDIDNPLFNKSSKAAPYFSPLQDPPSGTLVKDDENTKTPKLFTPLKLRGLELNNRIIVSPMCQYSSDEGKATPWHMAHVGGIITRGPGLFILEATSVTANGRITPEDAGLYNDAQAEELAKIVEFAHSQNKKIAIQLGHAGRKASTVAPWLSAGDVATEELGGWPEDVWAPSASQMKPSFPKAKEMSLQQIEQFKQDFAAAVKRAVKAGFDSIEIHNAHGYLLHEFISGATNHRTDQYGGSFENRVRLSLETVDIARANMPKDMPLLFRISASDYLEENENKELAAASWKSEDTVRLAPLLAEHGVDLLDVSAGGLHAEQKVTPGPGYQAYLAKAAKAAVGDKLVVTSVGSIDSGTLAEELVTEGGLDGVMVARGFQQDPALVSTWAKELGVVAMQSSQIRWGVKGRGPAALQHKK